MERIPQNKILIMGGEVWGVDGWLSPGYVWIEGDRILQVRAGDPPPEFIQAASQVFSARYKAVLPGLTNAHTHLSQVFMRGLSAERSLMNWLKDLIWPLQAAMTVDDLHRAALLGLVENLCCGVTHVVDHQKVTLSTAYNDAICQAAQEVGLRVTLARAWADRGKNAEQADDILRDLEYLFGKYQGDANYRNIRIASGPLTPWRCSAETLQKTHTLARQFGSGTHIHVSETQEEVQLTLNETGLRPVEWMKSIGVLDENVQVVHAVWVDEAEIKLLSDCGAPVIHCPVSNAVIASGVAPVSKLQQYGIKVFLGTDGPASNDTQDLFETIKWTLGLARVTTLNPAALTPTQVLDMATAGTRLQPGGLADIILVNLNTNRAMPVHDVTSALVLSTNGSDVDTVIVGGIVLLSQKRLQVLDLETLLDECRSAANALKRRAGVG